MHLSYQLASSQQRQSPVSLYDLIETKPGLTFYFSWIVNHDLTRLMQSHLTERQITADRGAPALTMITCDSDQLKTSVVVVVAIILFVFATCFVTPQHQQQQQQLLSWLLAVRNFLLQSIISPHFLFWLCVLNVLQVLMCFISNNSTVVLLNTIFMIY